MRPKESGGWLPGNDEQGRSRVVSDGPAPKHWSSPFQAGTSFTDIWRIESHPADLSPEETTVGDAWRFEPPELGSDSSGRPFNRQT